MAYVNESAVPIRDDIYWIGGDDRTASIFEGAFPIPEGVSYNSYLIRDEKTCLLDSCDASIAAKFWRNLRTALDGRPLDYFVINHMEPDHGACITQVLETWPDVTVIGNSKTFDMMENFYHIQPKNRMEVKEGDEVTIGKHTLRFYFAVMVHWPEVMFTYDVGERILFSADAFGTFKTLSGALYADETDFDREYLDEARRYYSNIVGKYGSKVQAVFKKLDGVPIDMICPLHGPIWRKDLGYILGKYDLWSRYEPEEKGVVIAYTSMYGNTAAAADRLAMLLKERIPSLVGGYLWLEREGYEEPWPFTPTIASDYRPTLFISRSCCRHDGLGLPCNGCTRHHEIALEQNGRRYIAYVDDCMTIVRERR